MNAGELTERISVLTLAASGTVYTWTQTAVTWAKAERLEKTNLFSAVGLGAKSVRFAVRVRDLTLHNAFIWDGKHCFLTDIVPDGRLNLAVTAAFVDVVSCTVRKMDFSTLDTLNRPVAAETTLSFPGVLTEKYLGHTQERPMAVTEARYVLVTPKAIELSAGDIAVIGGKSYPVLIAHTLDAYKNEYEVSLRGDA